MQVHYCPSCGQLILAHFVSISDSYGLKMGIQGVVACPACKEVLELSSFYPQTVLDHLYGELHLDRILDLDEE